MIKLLVTGLTFVSFNAFAQAPAVPAVAPAAQATAAATKMADAAVVHINTASVDELAKLPGIGAAKAKAIVAARPFKSIEDLKNVKGIKEGVFAKIKDKVAL